jgi:hypothetical protein
MHVSAQPGVVSKVITWIVGVVIENDVIGPPIPAGTEPDIRWGDPKVKASKPKPRRAATLKPIHV